ncbi:MAG: Glyoxalase/bleomycin resistance protein/dioxygenase [Rhodoglobus sp.]|nr:Glyoxalase/bleomycin resistance protein/dioxygenase [Rhodoglobus sp.]
MELLLAGVRVRDLAVSREWYERLLGRGPDMEVPDELVWDLAENRSIYLRVDPERSGHAIVTVFVDDLDALIAGITERGIEHTDIYDLGVGMREYVFTDPDGSEVLFGGAPG